MMNDRTSASQIPEEARRLFVALPLPGTVRDLIADVQAQCRPQRWPVKWVDPALAHITLKFLGDTDAALVPEIEGRLSQVSATFHPIHLNTAGCGAFPSLKRPQVLWVGVEGNVDSASRLAESLDSAMSGLGFEPERRAFRPHITIGRVRRGEKLPPGAGTLIEQAGVARSELVIDRFQLVQSVLGRSGPSYTTLAEWRLGTPSANRVELVEHG